MSIMGLLNAFGFVLFIFSASFALKTLLEFKAEPSFENFIIFLTYVAMSFWGIELMRQKSEEQIKREKEYQKAKNQYKKIFELNYKSGIPSILEPTKLLKMGITDETVDFFTNKVSITGKWIAYKKLFSINLKDIENVNVIKESEIIPAVEENKSVLGRAIAGDVLLGPLGAVVGGMSGVGKKTVKPSQKDEKCFIIITYNYKGIKINAIFELEKLLYANNAEKLKQAYIIKNTLLKYIVDAKIHSKQ